MSRELDELFSDEGGEPTPRTGLVISLLGGGLLLATAGMLCSAAPGGLIVLAAWLVLEKERDRVESGYLPADAGPDLQRLQTLAFLGLLVVILLFLVQAVLFYLGFYDVLWTAMADAAFGRDPGLDIPPDPPAAP